jgi:hypothetical protein
MFREVMILLTYLIDGTMQKGEDIVDEKEEQFSTSPQEV